jgi:formyltetrahydrofolate-dependent phosphoribosylglycinamide formyltransferase
MKRLVVLISGAGTNLQALIDATNSGEIEASIALVVSNRKETYGLERATQARIPTLYFPMKPYRDAGLNREQYDADLADKIISHQPDLIVLAGWMHIFSPTFLDQFTQKVINLHPALPGMFSGTHAIQRAYEAFQRGEIQHSGCMVHYVIPEVDAGAVIAQRIVPILENDSLEEFEARMHEAEHQLIVEATQKCLLSADVPR